MTIFTSTYSKKYIKCLTGMPYRQKIIENNLSGLSFAKISQSLVNMNLLLSYDHTMDCISFNDQRCINCRFRHSLRTRVVHWKSLSTKHMFLEKFVKKCMKNKCFVQTGVVSHTCWGPTDSSVQAMALFIVNYWQVCCHFNFSKESIIARVMRSLRIKIVTYLLC